MATRLALLIAVENPPQAALPAAAHAETDAAALARALVPLGFDASAVTVLAGAGATRTAVLSRLRKLTRDPAATEAIVLFWAGPVFVEAGKNYLACADTQADDRAETAVPLEALLEAMAGAGGGRRLLFLDPRSGPEESPFSLGGVQGFFASRTDAACFTARGPGEQSHISGSLKAGAWAHLVVEALRGRAPRALVDGHRLTAGSLQGYLTQELPRLLRATFREAPPQTPGLFGAAGLLVADVAGVLDEGQAVADPRLQPLKRGALRSETTAKVKSLAGYRKFHRLPERVNASARKFVAELAHDDVRHDVEDIYARLRESLGYKRRDVEGSADRGSGFVRTPDFEYSVSIDLAEDDPTTVVWRREVAGIRHPDVVLGRPFQKVFGSVFDTLVFEFTRPFDLEAWVDTIEEEMPAGVKVQTASDCSSCDVTVRGFAGVIRLFRDRVEIQGRQGPGSKGLVEAFLHFQDLFTGRRDLQELPLLEQGR